MTNVPWTRLEGSALWRAAEAAHASPAGRLYHGFGHPLRLYALAERDRLPYDLALDLAILAHDAVYDGLPEAERRSADWLVREAGGAFPDASLGRAEAMIMTTTRHEPGPGDAMALLDLTDLKDVRLSIANRETLAAEAALLSGTTRDAFMARTAAYMTALADGIDAGIAAGRCATVARRAAWAEISSGAPT